MNSDKVMKILFLAPANSIHTVKWVNALNQRGHNVFLVYQKGHSPIAGAVEHNVKMHMLKFSGTKGYYLNAMELNYLCKQIDPDVVNVHYASGYGTLARAARLYNTILSFWGSDIYEFPDRNLLNKTILLKNIKSARYIASTSHCMARKISVFSGIPETDINVTPFGVDTTRFNPNLYPKKNKDTVTIGTVKALEKVYNIQGLIEGFEMYLDTFKTDDVHGNIILKIYGKGSQQNYLEGLIKERHLENRVFLMGVIPNDQVPEVLSEMDVFCALSKEESFGVAILEAMAMKVPVITSSAEGFREILGEGGGGIILEKPSAANVACAIHELVTNKKKSRELGQIGYQLVRNQYSWEKCVDIMCNLYEIAKDDNEKSIKLSK